MKTNYHMHTTRCMHAVGKDEDYVISAIKAGFDEIGFSDHCPWPYTSGYVATMRMRLDELDDYVNSIRNLRDKYKDKISIKIGMECEYFECYMPWLKDIVKEYELDYLILGNHFYKTDESGIYFGADCNDRVMLDMYVDEAIKAMKTNLFAYIAHPELYMRGYPVFDIDCNQVSLRLCEAAKKYNIPLEYNLNGRALDVRTNSRYRYPNPQFWEIAAQVGCTAIIGYDAHDNKFLEDDTYYLEAIEYLDSLGIKRIDLLK
ncbi:MAG: histidinol-phosphatase [Erysipelotrichaceae bacterium]